MLSTAEFAEWSKKVVLCLHNTSRVDGEPYPSLLFEKGGIGFPTVSYLDGDGNLLKQVGNVVPLEDLEKAFQELQAWKALRAEVETGKAGASKEKELFLLELGMGNRPWAEMMHRRDLLTLTDNEVGDTEQPLVNLQFNEILRATPRDQQAQGGLKFLMMFREGRIPTATTETSFWQYMFAHATAKNDVRLFEELLTYLKDKRAGDKRLQRYLEQLEQQLADLKAKKAGDK